MMMMMMTMMIVMKIMRQLLLAKQDVRFILILLFPAKITT